MKTKTKFICSNCNAVFLGWQAKCTNCGNFGTIEEVEASSYKTLDKDIVKTDVQKLKNINIDKDIRFITGIKELNRVLGGGVVKDSVNILTARPGCGKSTLLLQLALDFARKKIKTLYISAEESALQIKSRANRITKDIPDDIFIHSTTIMDDAIKSIKKTDAEIIILDSIQTVTLNEFTARAASPTQTVECISKLVTLAKDPNKKRAVFIVCHMTKQDEMAGLRTLEHMVDSVLLLEGQSDDSLRTLTSTKNRFGRTGEVGLFKMEENGLLEIENPSEFFVTKREKDICASALSVVKEGSRMLVVEVESLVSKSFTNYPIRIGDSLKKDQLNTLISILEQRAGFNLYDRNVILKVTGGLSITEQAVNLAVIVSIVSSILNKPIARDSVFICEVGLTGELKKVTNIKERLLELDRMGYKKAYISYENTIPKEIKNLKVEKSKTLKELIDKIF
ncbi:putative DNA repair protein RadA [Tissierellia bacterium KA00581]|nr:putative DNA repair protein RadA [Tissierellia bacterium KA00581]